MSEDPIDLLFFIFMRIHAVHRVHILAIHSRWRDIKSSNDINDLKRRAAAQRRVCNLGEQMNVNAAIYFWPESFSPLACDIIGSICGAGSSPLLPHFDADITTITDLDGEPLTSIAPEFVSVPESYLEVAGSFPNYPMRIPTACS